MLTDLEQTRRFAREDRARLDEECALTDRLAESLTTDGFGRHFVPERWGGCAGTFTALLDAVSVLSETCASTAWCGALYASHSRLASYLPEAGQRELWGGTLTCGSPPRSYHRRAARNARATAAVDRPVAAASGVRQAEWILLASGRRTRTATRGGRVPPPGRVARRPGAGSTGSSVPRDQVRVLDNWHPSACAAPAAAPSRPMSSSPATSPSPSATWAGSRRTGRAVTRFPSPWSPP
ncbi:acyl-CoA dehydrogenase family protein [Streptomyces tsukubensis]|uniref:hypothetical protein n=1 Tax=Streptomyces tsukubensis TaxID=83656 RepID=UPI0018730657|nr:hypothetical protein [Streptomyces tsukubensis]